MSTTNWEKELVKELDVTWGDAKAILQIAKDSLGIDQKENPEESKEEIFKKCHEVAESFEKTPKPAKAAASSTTSKPVDDGEEEKVPETSTAPAPAPAPAAKPKSSVKSGNTESSMPPVTPGLPRPTTTQEQQERDNKLMVAVIFTIFVVAIIIGVTVGIKNNRNGEEPTAAPTEEVTLCEPVEQLFALPVMVSMAVSSSITEDEIAYTASLMQKTYTALLAGFLEEAQDYCDPYCRTITGIEVIGYELTGNATNETFVEEGCDDTLVMSYAVDGAFLGCEGADFPGMFAQLRRRLIALRRGRFLQATCGDCPGDSGDLGQIAPTGEELVEIMDPFVSILPTVCQLNTIEAMEDQVKIEIVNATDMNATDIPEETGEPDADTTAAPEGGTETQGAPEEGWTDALCSVSVNPDSCATLFAANVGVVPCSCDGKCVNFVDGGFDCNDSGAVSGSSIDAAGCSFAEHASFPGFTCAV
jgi:hypothetical protein